MPLAPFASSSALASIGRAAIVVIAASGLVVLITSAISRTTLIVGLLIAAMIATSLMAGRGLDARAYVQFAQLLAFGLVVANHRMVEITPRARAALSIVLGLVASANLALPFLGLTGADEFMQFTGAFDNPNALGIASAALAILTLALARATTTRTGRFLVYVLLAVFVGFIVIGGSRSALLIVAIYLAVLALQRFARLQRGWLATLGFATLFGIVPLVTLGYPAMLGQAISFLPSTQFAPDPASVASQLAEAFRTDGGLLGLNKRPDSGRQIIWPIVISAGGESPIWGHGAGSHPGHLLPSPYDSTSAHNGYLQIYYQLGLVGLGLYLLLWATLFVRAAQFSDATAAVATMCAAAWLDLFEVVMIQNHFGIGIAFAVLMTATVRSTNPPGGGVSQASS